jgi:ankyrin repeat protein
MPVGDGESLLTLAIVACQKNIVELLLDRGANVNGKDSDTPLVAAAGNGEDDIVALLLSRGAQIDKTDAMGHTALEDAVRQRHFLTVKALLQAGPDVNRDIGGGATVLAIVDHSADPNEARIARLLSAHGATAQYADLNCGVRCQESED